MSHRRFAAIADLQDTLRRQWADLPVNLRRWRDDVKEDRSLLWRTPAVRISLWILAGIIVLVAVRTLIAAVTPSTTSTIFVEPTPLATLYVACTDAQCRHSYVSRQPMDFDDWPLACETCQAEAVYRAKLCDKCRSWFATAPNQPDFCPTCAARAAAAAPVKDEPKDPSNPDDKDDDW